MNKPTNAGHELADVIERAIGARNPTPGSVVGSEQAIRDEVGAGRAVFRQAMRILQHRGTLTLRRGQGGG
ncbi:MAG: GntR family transcriptional regulator, partial [Rhizorhabdus sp.]|nr:GntR family transcriptional regulator [Rhizorhabdus sp.]